MVSSCPAALRGTSDSSTSLSPAHVEVIKATRAVVGAHMDEIVADFYPRMLKNNPEVLEFFNMSNQRSGRQAQALAEAILMYASNIENLAKLGGAVERIAHKHCALNVRAPHYKIVHDNLMVAVANVLGNAVTAEIASAWSAAVNFLGQILIKRETELYEESEKVAGGWKERRTFVVAEKKSESSVICSFKFKPEDAQPISTFRRGQYIAVASNPTSEPLLAPRHYTLINQPGDDFYELGIRKHSHDPSPGVMSCWLHSLKVGDKVELFPPFGVDTFKPTPNTKVVVLISSGAGITQSLALLPDVLASKKQFLVCHADGSPHTHAFRDRVEHLAGNNYKYFYKEAVENTSNVVSDGRMTAELIMNSLNDLGVSVEKGWDQVQVYMCCSPRTTEQLYAKFMSYGAPRSNLISAAFGPHIPHACDNVVLNA